MQIQADSAFVPSTRPSMDSGHASAYVETSAGQAGLHLQRHILVDPEKLIFQWIFQS